MTSLMDFANNQKCRSPLRLHEGELNDGKLPKTLPRQRKIRVLAEFRNDGNAAGGRSRTRSRFSPTSTRSRGESAPVGRSTPSERLLVAPHPGAVCVGVSVRVGVCGSVGAAMNFLRSGLSSFGIRLDDDASDLLSKFASGGIGFALDHITRSVNPNPPKIAPPPRPNVIKVVRPASATIGVD